MPIRVQCDNSDCRTMIVVKDDLAGKRIKCVRCGRVLTVRPPAPSAARPPHAVTPSPPNDTTPVPPKRREVMAAEAKRGNSKKKAWLLGCGIAAGVMFLCCGGFAMLGITIQKSNQRALAEANQHWDAGRKADAVAQYKSVLMTYSTAASREELPKLFERIIDFEIETGDMTAARRTMDKAVEYQLTLNLTSDAAKDLLDVATREAGSFSVPFERTDRLTNTDPPIRRERPFVGGNPMKWYTIKLKKGDVVLIQMKSKAIDSYLVIESLDGMELGANDDDPNQPRGATLDAALRFAATKDGAYRVVATCYTEIQKNKHGEFRLTVSKIQ